MNPSDPRIDDLFAELVTMNPRWEWQPTESCSSLPLSETPFVAGIRADGRWTIYFPGGDYIQLDLDNRVRRAFLNGASYLSGGSTLVRLEKQRGEVVTLLRRELAGIELEQMLAALTMRLAEVSEQLERRKFIPLRQFPANGLSLEDQLLPRLAQLLAGPLQLAPNMSRPSKTP